MKRKLIRSGVLLALIFAVVAVVPALRIRTLGWFRGEMFLRTMPYSQWIGRLDDPKTRGSAEGDLKAAGTTAVPLLVKMLLETNPDLRWEAARILGDIGPAAGPNADRAARALLSAMYDSARDKRIDDEQAGLDNPPVYDSPALETRAKRTSLASQAAEQALVSIGPAAVPALIDGLKDQRRLTRADAARLLGRLGTEAGSAAGPLAEVLASEQDGVAQWEQCNALDRVGAEPATRAMAARDVLVQAAPRARRWAAETLAGLGPDLTKPALPALLKVLEQPIDQQSARAVDRVLARFGDQAAPRLVVLALGENDTARLGAADALAQVGAPALPALAKALKDPDLIIRRRAVHTLRIIGPPAAPLIGPIAQLASDSDAIVRRETIDALAAIAPAAPETAAAIIAAVGDGDPAVRHTAVKALSVLPPGTAGAGDAAARAVQDPQIRADGIAAIAVITPPPDAIPALLPVLADAAVGHGVEPSPGHAVRDCQLDAINALAGLGDRARPALESILEALKSTDAPLAAAAISALPRIDPKGELSIPFLIDLLKSRADHWTAVKALLALGATRQAFAAIAADIRSTDPSVARRGIEWVYADRTHGQDEQLFDDVVPALVEQLGNETLSTSAGEALEQLTAWPALVPALTRGMQNENRQIARGSASVLEDIALYNRQSATGVLAATALREALTNPRETNDPELKAILTRAVTRLGPP